MKEDSPTVMFGNKTSETKMTLWNMKEGSIGVCGNDSTEAVVLLKEDFTMGKINICLEILYVLRNLLINLRTLIEALLTGTAKPRKYLLYEELKESREACKASLETARTHT